MFETHHEPLLPARDFRWRLVRGITIGLAVLLGALGLGMAGYHGFEHMSWMDAFVNAAMILSGMGPLEPLRTEGGKLFAGLYALMSGLAFAAVLGLIFAPVVHRFLHVFHKRETERDAARVSASPPTTGGSPSARREQDHGKMA